MVEKGDVRMQRSIIMFQRRGRGLQNDGECFKKILRMI